MIVLTRKLGFIARGLVSKRTGSLPLKIKVIIAFGAIYVIWGTTYLAIRFAIDTIPPFFMMGCRFLAAGTFLYSWARFRGEANPRFQQWRTAVVIGILLFLGGHGALAWSEQVLPSGIAALIAATTPIWMILLSHFRSPVGRIGRRAIIGLVLGFLGTVLIIEPTKLIGGQTVDLIGATVLLVGTISWCSGSVYSKYTNLPKSPQLVSGMTMLCGGTALVLVSLLTGESDALSQASALSLLSLFYLVLFGSITAFTAYIWLLNTVSPAQVSTYAFVNPIIAVFVGWFGGGESLSPRLLLAAFFMIAGVGAIVSHESEKSHSMNKGKSERLPDKSLDLKEKNPKNDLEDKEEK